MLPLHRKEKMDDVKQNSFPYRFAKPAMFTRARSRLTPRQVQVGGFLVLLLFLWLILRGGERVSRHKSPYAASSHYIGPNDNLPIVDFTIQECTKWRWFQSRSKCTSLVKDGWEVSGGALLLAPEKKRDHLSLNPKPLG